MKWSLAPKIFDPMRMTQSPMKYLAHAARCSIAGLLLCLLPVTAGFAQQSNQCESYDVMVDMWNLPQTIDSDLSLGEIRMQFLSITDAVLDHINAHESFESSDAVPHVDPANAGTIAADMNGIRDAYCVRRGRLDPNDSRISRAYPYTALVRPILEEPYTYEIRGLHLLSKESGAEDRPQLILKFKIESTSPNQSPLVSPNVLLTGLEVFNFRDYQVDAQNTTASRIDQVRNLIEQFGNAYNAGSLAEIENSLEVVLDDDLLTPGDVEIFESSNRKNSRGVYEQKIGDGKNANTYLNSIASRLSRYGKTEVTFDVIDVYRIPSSDEGEVYRATVLQHYMFEEAFQGSRAETYMDSDYLAIDVIFNANNRPVIKLRKAGRGTFVVRTDPSGVNVSSVNGHELSGYDIRTPLDYLLNVPLQHHRITLNNVWYESESINLEPPSVKPEYLNGIDTTVVMTHKDAYMVLNVEPPYRADDMQYNIGNGATPINAGDVITLTKDELDGDPPSGGAITTDQRTTNLTVTAPALDNYEVMNETVTWNRPDTQNVIITFPRGRLEIASTPDQSTATIIAPDGSSRDETTLVAMDAYATLPGDEMAAQVSNGQCYQDDPEVDECRFHIPSEIRSGIAITPGETTRENFELTPFLVQDQTRAGDISNVELTRDDMMLTVAYTINDNKDRDRRFMLDFDMINNSTGERSDLDDQVLSCFSTLSSGETSTSSTGALECIGDDVRPGTHYYTWDMSNWGLDTSNAYTPVLSLRRKGTCLPCILIPVAAGAAAAIIFPRTGSNETPTFVPPPRPTETQNR